MKTIKIKTICTIFCLLASLHLRATAEDARVFVLKKAGNDVALEAVVLRDGETKEFAHANGDITVVFPQSAGRAGDFIRLSMGFRFRVQLSQGAVSVKLIQPSGAERVLANLTSADMRKYDVRLNVTAKTLRRAFVIRAAESIVQDSIAPVTDMFRGQIPFMGEDYALTIETLQRPSATMLAGETAITILPIPGAESARYLMLRGSIGGGKEGDWVLDLAAASTLVARSALPNNTTVEKALMTEISGRGQRSVPMSIGGAGGSVEGLGAIKLPEIRFGTLTVTNEEVFVADSLPRIGGRAIAGILGMDILRRADGITLEFLSETQGVLRCAAVIPPEKILAGSSPVPISFANGHLFARGEATSAVGVSIAIACLFDSGSPYSFVGQNLEQCVAPNSAQSASARGLDGKPITTREGVLQQFRVRGAAAADGQEYLRQSVKIATLPVITNMGANMPILLLGNDFLLRHKVIAIDFVRSVAYLRTSTLKIPTGSEK